MSSKVRMGEISAETAGRIRRFITELDPPVKSLPEFMEMIGQALPANDQGMTAEDGAAAILEACGLSKKDPAVEHFEQGGIKSWTYHGPNGPCWEYGKAYELQFSPRPGTRFEIVATLACDSEAVAIMDAVTRTVEAKR